MVRYITVIFPHAAHKPTQIMGMAHSHKKAGDTCFTATMIQLHDRTHLMIYREVDSRRQFARAWRQIVAASTLVCFLLGLVTLGLY